MRLVMTLLVRDEEDILEANLDIHQQFGVDHFVVTDNLSEDRTPQILERYAAQGVLTWRRETDDDYAQHRWVTRMAREAAVDHGADWVLNNDADEFWWPRDGDLKVALADLPVGVGGVAVPRVDFLARPDAPGPFWERMTVRTRPGRKVDGKRLLPKVAHRAHPEVEIAQGNHAVEAPGLGEVVDTDRIEILHFPVRSYAQYENKIVKGGRAYHRNTELPTNMGKRWRHGYERYLEGTLRDDYEQHVLDEVEVDRGLAEGRFVEDHRLRDHLAPRPRWLGPLRRLTGRGAR